MFYPEILSQKLAEKTALQIKLDRINGTTYKSDELTRHFHLGRVGGSGRNTARLNRQRERDLDKTIDNAKKALELNSQINRLELEIIQLERGTWKPADILRQEQREKDARIDAALKQKYKAERAAMTAEQRLFIGQFPGGISYADRAVMQGGDYKKLAFRSNRGEVTWYAKRIPADLKKLIEEHLEKESQKVN